MDRANTKPGCFSDSFGLYLLGSRDDLQTLNCKEINTAAEDFFLWLRKGPLLCVGETDGCQNPPFWTIHDESLVRVTLHKGLNKGFNWINEWDSRIDD